MIRYTFKTIADSQWKNQATVLRLGVQQVEKSTLLYFACPSVASDSVLPVQLRWTNVHRAMHSLRRNPPQVGILAKTVATINLLITLTKA